jgi:hypothetical protein
MRSTTDQFDGCDNGQSHCRKLHQIRLSHGPPNGTRFCSNVGCGKCPSGVYLNDASESFFGSLKSAIDLRDGGGVGRYLGYFDSIQRFDTNARLFGEGELENETARSRWSSFSFKRARK